MTYAGSEREKEIKRAWYQKNKERLQSSRKEYSKTYWLRDDVKQRYFKRNLAKFSLNSDSYQALLKEQNYRCAICRTSTPTGRGSWHIDHCHTTNIVRGLLCSQCNTGIGLFKDNSMLLSNAIDYLNKIPDKYHTAGNTQWL